MDSRGPRNAALGSVTHVLCRTDKLSKAMIIPILSVGCGNHGLIMVPAEIGSSVRDRSASLGGRRCRQLAQ
jgi:hypothetical protein